MSLALGQQHRLQGFDVVGKRGIDAHAAISAGATGPCNVYRSCESPCRIGALNLPSAAAMYAAAAASRCLPAGSPAAPA
jgi:hypothetical protein